MMAVLTPEQLHRYEKACGYGGAGAAGRTGSDEQERHRPSARESGTAWPCLERGGAGRPVNRRVHSLQ